VGDVFVGEPKIIRGGLKKLYHEDALGGEEPLEWQPHKLTVQCPQWNRRAAPGGSARLQNESEEKVEIHGSFLSTEATDGASGAHQRRGGLKILQITQDAHGEVSAVLELVPSVDEGLMRGVDGGVGVSVRI
jgi:hypothetical protein